MPGIASPLRLAPSLLAAGALAALPATAAAHAHLVSTTPAAGANLDAAPTVVALTFDAELDPAGSSFSVTDQHGDEVGTGSVDLGVADRNVLRGSVEIDEPGVYTVAYTVLGLDGHEISGSFSFGYDSHEEVPSGQGSGHSHENPDTALGARGGGPPLAAAGIGLVLLAGLLGARRRILR